MRNLVFEIRNSFIYFRKYLLLTIVIFVLSLLSGMLLFANDKLPIHPTSLEFVFIFKNNFLVALTIIATGIFSLGVLGNLILAANALLLGKIFIGVFNLYGISPLLRYVAPHFVFEISALLLATCISCETSKFFYNFRHTDVKVIRLRYDLIFFILLILLLLIAAFIESML